MTLSVADGEARKTGELLQLSLVGSTVSRPGTAVGLPIPQLLTTSIIYTVYVKCQLNWHTNTNLMLMLACSVWCGLAGAIRVFNVADGGDGKTVKLLQCGKERPVVFCR